MSNFADAKSRKMRNHHLRKPKVHPDHKVDYLLIGVIIAVAAVLYCNSSKYTISCTTSSVP